MELNLVVDGTPVPKGRARSGKGNHYTPERTRAAQAAIVWEAKAARVVFDPADRVELHLTFMVHRWRGDLDNLEKLVMDALQDAGVYKNDRQVKRKFAEEMTIPKTDQERTVIRAVTW